MSDTEHTIEFGPGAVHLSGDEGVGWVSADVALKTEYENNGQPGSTRAVLELVAIKIDPVSSSDEVHVSIELTEGDVLLLMETLHAISIAIKEDETDG